MYGRRNPGKLEMLKQKLLGVYIDENLRWTDHTYRPPLRHYVIQNFIIETTFYIYPK